MASRVFLARLEAKESDDAVRAKLRKLCKRADIAGIVPANKPVALKTHFGEDGNTTYIRSEEISPIVEMVKEAGGLPFFVETSTLYRGQRSNAVRHFMLAEEHGFGFRNTGCPLIFVDGLMGHAHLEVEVNLKHFKSVAVAADFPLIPAAIIITHVTGHMLAGLGGAIKNVAMGLASRAGKLRMHESGLPQVKDERCIRCGTCVKWCPADAIALQDVAVIDYDECLACGECLAVCPQEAVVFSWSESATDFNEKMVEYTCGILKGKMSSVAFVTFIRNVTRDCNCMGNSAVVCPDVGMIAAFDPVASDQAVVDLVNEAAGIDLFAELFPNSNYQAQLSYGERVGLGSRRYELIEV